MRFLANGPDIPDDLLRARDEGRVVFFCGAGVSFGRAKLPDFYGLTSQVIDYLRATDESPAVKRFTLPSRIADSSNGSIGWQEVASLISADQIFADLYREFPSVDVDTAVARALKLNGKVDTSAHEIIKKLATTPSGRLRLITTNFDRLFEADSDEQIWTYPALPDLTQEGAPDGIVYLHGRVSDDGKTAHPPGFILSSPEFGEAYMADGRATAFIKDLIERFVVVFIGYSADDPPVRYLLEALGNGSKTAGRLYAFQAGNQTQAEGQWANKGVTAISYSDDDGHAALWDALEDWSKRAEDPNAWIQSVLDLAETPPSQLRPYQRGWIAHLVSSREGAKLFANTDKVIPAEWLYVFDPNKRFAAPSRAFFDRDSELSDPFDLYGLDSDPRPLKLNEDDNFDRKRAIPETAWSAFMLNDEDLQNATPSNLASYANLYTSGVAVLPERLSSLGRWVGKRAESPAALAWAISQPMLNSEIRSQIEWHIDKLEDKNPDSHITQQWRILFESWDTNLNYDAFDMRWYRFEKRNKNSEWSESTIRDFQRSSCPRISIRQSYSLSSTAPTDDQTDFVLHREIIYPDCRQDLSIPDKWLPRTLEALRNNLLLADRMEDEIGYRTTYELIPIRRGDDPSVNRYRGTRDLCGLLSRYTSDLQKLQKLDEGAAQDEIRSWPRGESLAFARLRCWVLGEPHLVPPGEWACILDLISNEMLWHSGNQRDLLTSLKAVWNDLTDLERNKIEARLLKGPSNPSWIDDKKEAEEWQAKKVLSYFGYLTDQGCEFGFDLDATTKRLKLKAPNWNSSYSASAADEMGSRGGMVTTKTEHDQLLFSSLENLLDVASERSGRTEDFLIKTDPFLGLSKSRPVRAMAALRLGSNAEQPRTEFWRTFFSHDARKDDHKRLSTLILARLTEIDDAILRPILYNLTWWLRETAEHHSTVNPEQFDKIMERIITMLQDDQDLNKSTIIRNSARVDWSGNALNSAPGHLADALMSDSRRGNAEQHGFPEVWINCVHRLLKLPGDGGALVLATISRNIGYVHYHNEHLADKLISLAFESGGDAFREAFWSGFDRSGQPPCPKLYPKIRSHMLSRVKQKQASRGGNFDALGAFVLGGWRIQSSGQARPLLTDSELSDVILNGSDDFRRSILHYLQDWALTELSKDDPSPFLDHAREFFDKVWPRQLSVRTPTVSRAIKDLLTRDAQLMELFFVDAYPYLTQLESHTHLYFREEDEIVREKPRKLLKVIAAILPNDVRFWPYGLTQLLDRLVEAEPKLADDADLQRMRNRLA